MTWLYVPSAVSPSVLASEGLNSRSSSPSETDTVLWPTLSGIPSQRPLSWPGWKKRPWIERLSGTISRPSMALAGVEWWISSLRASHVSHGRRQDEAKARTMSAGSGPTLLESLARWDQDSSSWRTCDPSLPGAESSTFSGTWPTSGSMRNGKCWRRPTSRPRTNVNASTSWPTPRASMSRMKCHLTASRLAAGAGGKRNLEEMVALVEGDQDGYLNPMWVEWLMGLPMGWTDSMPLETGSFHLWQRQHSAALRNVLGYCQEPEKLKHGSSPVPGEPIKRYNWKEFVAKLPVRPKVDVVHHAPWTGHERPGDAFNRLHPVQSVLESLGFAVSHQDAQGVHLVRPNKDAREGHSATIYADAPNKVVIWSATCSQWWPSLQLEKPYDSFGLFTATSHNGDFEAATADLRKEGYGDEQENGDWLIRGVKALTPSSGEPRAAVLEPKPSSNPASRRSNLVTLSEVEGKEVTWLWEGRVPFGKVTLIDGDPGVSKSTLTLDIAARSSTGSPMPGEQGGRKPSDVLLLSAEDDAADTIKPRLQSHGADLKRVHLWKGEERTIDQGGNVLLVPVSFPSGAVNLESLIVERHAGLVVIDPMAAFYDPGIQTNNDASVRLAMTALCEVAQRTGAAIVIVRHLTKDPSKPAMYRGGGSIGIMGAARSAMVVAKDPSDEKRRVLAPVKMNLAELPARSFAYYVESDPEYHCGHIHWDGEVDITADQLLSQQGKHETQIDKAEDWLVEQLSNGPKQSKWLESEAQKAGHALITLRRAGASLGVERYKSSGKTGVWMCKLPEEEPEQLAMLPRTVEGAHA
jgi:AAA domain